MKSKLNSEMIKKLSGYIAEGNYASVACALAGISEKAFYTWVKQGEADIEAGVESPFSKLIQAVKSAEAIAEAERVARIRKSGEKGNWLADITHLERRHPERWGRKDRIQVDETKTQEINVIIKHYQDEIQPGQPVPQIVEGEGREVPQIEGQTDENNVKIDDKGGN